MRSKKVKNLPDGIRIDTVKVKIPGAVSRGLPRRNYYYIYSLTFSTTWVKTNRFSDRVYPILMMKDEILNLEIYEKRK